MTFLQANVEMSLSNKCELSASNVAPPISGLLYGRFHLLTNSCFVQLPKPKHTKAYNKF